MIRKLLISFFALLASNFVSADAYHNGTKILQINGGYPSGEIFFKATDEHLNPANCENPLYYGIDPETNDVNSSLSLLLAAKATNANISVRVSDTVCFKTYPKVVILILK